MIRTTAVLLLGSLLAACAPPTGAEGDALIWARGSKSNTLDPAEVEWGEDAKVTQSLYETLVTFKRGSVELGGRLAEKWAFGDDRTSITFDLRKGVKFHDGTEFNSDAVVFSFGRLIDPDHPYRPKTVPYEANFSDIADVKADGSHRVVLTLKNPSSVLLHNLTLFGASIVSPDAVKKHGARFGANPVGTGPYRLERWERDVKIDLRAFPDYWGTKPAVSRVIVVPVQSPQTAIEKLKRGEVHVVDHPTLGDVKPLQDLDATKVDVQTSMNICYLGFNMKKFPYNDINFRRAVALAIDRNDLNKLVYFGQAVPAANIVPPAIWGDISETPPYEFSLEKAKEHLAKVKLESKEVELIHMTFARPYVPEPLRVAEWIRDQLRKIGLTVKLTGYDQRAYTVKYKEDSHPMCLLGWNADIAHPDNFFYPLLHGDSAEHLNPSFFDDPEFNEAVTQAQKELDEAKRRDLYAKAFARYRDQLPTVPLVHVNQITALGKNVSFSKHPIEYRFYEASLSE